VPEEIGYLQCKRDGELACSEETPMLALEERFMIRDLYRKGVSMSEIARRAGRDRKTIREARTSA
jgi:IS30 family transposase